MESIKYSKIVEKLVEKIHDVKSYSCISNKNIESLDKFLGMDVVKHLYGTKGKYIKFIFKLFGITFESGKIVTSNYTETTLKKLIEQVKPYRKCFSRNFIASISKIVNMGVSNPNKKIAVINHIKTLISNKSLLSAMNTYARDKMRIDGEVETVDTNNVDVYIKEAALKKEINDLQKQISKNNLTTGSREIMLERIENAIAEITPSLKFVSDRWKGDKTFNHNESATEVLHISDWHIGEVDNIGGFNQFNYEIACERVKTLTNKVISWTKMHRSMYNVDELVIIATGDMISGDIHDELRATNEFPVPEQCVKAAVLISKMTSELSTIFKKVRVEYIVHDNHSRTTKKMEFAPGTNSYNYIVGMMSKMMLDKNANVEFNVYPEIQRIVKIENLKYLITHGNSIRGGFAGIPYYGLNRKLGAEALIRMNMPDEAHFNRIVMGHYHTPFMNNAVEMTGCLSSTTAFDHASGRHSPACQTAWLVSKKFEMDYSVFWLS